jgi:hypothetical protein
LWREMRQNHLGNRVFPDGDLMYDAVSTAWMKLRENPQCLTSLCGFNWITDYFSFMAWEPDCNAPLKRFLLCCERP